MLSNGEYVINAKSTARFRPLLEAINSGRYGMFSGGGDPNDPLGQRVGEMWDPRQTAVQPSYLERFQNTLQRVIMGNGAVTEEWTKSTDELRKSLKARRDAKKRALSDAKAAVGRVSAPGSSSAYVPGVGNLDFERAFPHSKAMKAFEKTSEKLKEKLEAGKISASKYNTELQKAVDLYNSSEDAARAARIEQEIVNRDNGRYAAEQLKDGFKSGLSSFLKGETSFKQFATDLLDQFTSTIIDTMVNSFTDSLFEGLGLDKWFEDLFASIGDWFSGLGEKAAGGMKGSGGGGGLLSSLGEIGSWVASFFADGGLVSGPGGPRSDLIPAMLSNGEYVVNAKATKGALPLLEALNGGKFGKYANGGLVGGGISTTVAPTAPSIPSGSRGGNSATFKIENIGDVSRQTRQEVTRMVPELAAAINSYNREKGIR